MFLGFFKVGTPIPCVEERNKNYILPRKNWKECWNHFQLGIWDNQKLLKVLISATRRVDPYNIFNAVVLSYGKFVKSDTKDVIWRSKHRHNKRGE